MEDGESQWAAVFCPSPILKACTIIDTPGFSASDEDTDRAEEAVRSAELIIYCSPFITCFDAEDQLRIGRLLRALPCPETIEPSLPPLSNIVFAITHAGPQVNERQLTGIQAKTCQRFLKAFREVLASRAGDRELALNEDDIRSMFVPFWSETRSRHREMRARSHSMLAVDFPKFRRRLADQEISRFRDQASEEVRQKVQFWEEFLLRWEEQKRLFEEAEQNEPQRKAKSEATKQKIISKIRDYCERSVGEFNEYFNGSFSVDGLEHHIRSNFNSKDEAAKGVGPLIFRQLEGKTADTLKQYSEKLAKRINSFLREYNEAGGRWSGVSGDCSGAAGATPAFDAAAAFAGGLAGLATFGALAFWASTLGNLGGYIIVAKAIGLLAAIGISTGSAATVIAVVAAFGGPVVFAAALAVIAAIGAIMFFWKSWQRRMAERIHEDLNKQNLRGKIEQNIREFWNHTETAFVKAAENTEAAYQKEFNAIKADLQSDSRHRIEKQLGAFQKLASFFDKLPWFGFDARGTGGNNRH
jgi:hypothetical protein